MSDDTDRLDYQLEDIRALADGLRDFCDAFNDVVAAVKPVELETDPEGHVALRDRAFDARRAFQELEALTKEVFAPVAVLTRKARLP